MNNSLIAGIENFHFGFTIVHWLVCFFFGGSKNIPKK